ncbi:dipeptide ABC transporter ATP-binding protein [Leucobacter komagatae]|uniref:ABC transporter domain-containing protein n=1 Tax=Leucobacter komagatae TaxID=55969 RepID=A0A0D0IPR6_9MICO|nr:ABC transporter ATP-binding protein [Leucobacter komagatae]KIP53589.1 hypothetical protein SD72_02750 [Leucobacter komagatae]
MSALEVRDLAVEYQGRRSAVRAVDGISMSIAPGELVAVVGETGSGKTTAALAAIGLLPETAKRVRGSVAVGGRDITGWNRRRLRALHGTEIGLIPQDPTSSLDPLVTVGKQVAEAIRIHRGRHDLTSEVHELLHRVGLSDPERIARSYPHQLSGGQRQRALIAGAIALKPALLVADESTSALDVTMQRRVLDLLDDLRREEGTGILLVTHDLAVAAERANHIVVLQHGTVQDAGPAATILGGGTSAYTRELVASAPALRAPQPRTPIGQREPAGGSEAQAAGIRIRGLEKRFAGAREVLAVRGVDLDVLPGTTHSIVGESGSGKSTIARIVAGLDDASAGSVTVAGMEPSTVAAAAKKREFRRRVQLVYQSPYASLNPSRSIIDTVSEPIFRFGIADRREAKRRAASLLDRMQLPSTLHERRPEELSGGQRQRVAIARALAPQPEVVVLDEPVSALDVSVQAQILDLLDELQRERALTYLFISHDLAVVRQISDAVTVLQHGAVEETGPTERIFTAPQAEYTRRLLEAIPTVDPTLLHH